MSKIKAAQTGTQTRVGFCGNRDGIQLFGYPNLYTEDLPPVTYKHTKEQELIMLLWHEYYILLCHSTSAELLELGLHHILVFRVPLSSAEAQWWQWLHLSYNTLQLGPPI